MEEKELKTSAKQRFFIILVAVIMLGSMIAGYAAIIATGGSSNTSSNESVEIDEAKIAEYEEAYNAKVEELADTTQNEFNKFIGYEREAVKAYNETNANGGGISVKDYEVGTGNEVSDDNYLAFYVGWCADEMIFDSSFDSSTSPKAFEKVLDPSLGMIEGWNLGVEGMKTGGVREITVSSELAYGDDMEICGGYNKPLKFLVMAVAKVDPLKTLAEEIDKAYMRLQYAYYGIDYDNMIVEE